MHPAANAWIHVHDDKKKKHYSSTDPGFKDLWKMEKVKGIENYS